MARKAKPAPLDVFLSYKREEKAVAQLLAEFLTERGFDVWWDAALLAGDDFAAIVHEEVREAKAVVVLWSRQAIDSHWVKAEATLALAGGTLINAVIDDLPFDEIPVEFRHIQAVRLGDDRSAFFTAIATAIARKGTSPSQSRQSAAAARTTLDKKVGQSEFFLAISQSSDPLDFRDYLDRYGDTGQFASIAMRKIIALEQQQAERRKLSSRVWLALGSAATVFTIVAGVIALLQFAGIGGTRAPVVDKPGEAPPKDGSGGVVPPVEAPGAGTGTIEIPEPVDPAAPRATYTTYQFGVPMVEVHADVEWSTVLYLGGSNVVATADFSKISTSFEVTLTDPGTGIGAEQIILSVTPTATTLLGPLPPAAITSVGAVGFIDERRLIGTALPTEGHKLSYGLDADANREAGNFTVLVGADALVIDLNLEGDQTAVLRLEPSPEIRPALETLLNRQAKPLLETLKDIYVTPADPQAAPLTPVPVTQ